MLSAPIARAGAVAFLVPLTEAGAEVRPVRIAGAIAVAISAFGVTVIAVPHRVVPIAVAPVLETLLVTAVEPRGKRRLAVAARYRSLLLQDAVVRAPAIRCTCVLPVESHAVAVSEPHTIVGSIGGHAATEGTAAARIRLPLPLTVPVSLIVCRAIGVLPAAVDIPSPSASELAGIGGRHRGHRHDCRRQ